MNVTQARPDQDRPPIVARWPSQRSRRSGRARAPWLGRAISGAARLLVVATLGVPLSFETAGAIDMALPGSFGVGPTGSATYTIPIEVPPGTAGLTPTLTLQYDSNASNGILGMGWSLGGLPSITRCPRTVAQDGVVSGVSYGATDQFCVGGQRLVVINGGTYGADQSEYRTETDSYARVISHSVAGVTGPGWFELHTKSGQVLALGNTSDSRIMATGTQTARAWAVNQVSDGKGNYYAITYTVVAPEGQVWPASIAYTGNTATGQQPYNSVQFTVTTRADNITAYHAGSIQQTTVLLTNIKTYTGTQLVSDYQLYYQTPAGVPVSQLVSMRRCGGDDVTCLPPTTFTWSPSNVDATGFSTAGSTLPGGLTFGSPLTWMPITGDFNGDGKMDYLLINGTLRYVFLSNGGGTFQPIGATLADGLNFGSPITAWTPITGDFNGDGLTDYMLISGTSQYVFLSNGDGTFRPIGSTIPGGVNFDSPITGWTPLAGDFNGDGRTDYMMITGGIRYVFLSNGDGTFQVSAVTLAGGVTFGAPPTADWIPITGDFNGDGLTDYVMINGTLQYVYLSNGDGTFQQAGFTLPGGLTFGSPITSWLPIVGDFNGDGLTDYMMVNPTLRYLFTSNGNGTFQVAGASLPNGLNLGSPITNWLPIAGDFNGDGKADYMLVSANLRYLFASNGDGTFQQTGVTVPNAPNFGTPITLWTPIVGDFGGDGKTDYALIAGATQYAFMTDTVSGQHPFSRLTSITTGLGATIAITYQPLTNSSIYTKDSAVAYPVQNVQPSAYVTAQVNAANGIGGTYGLTYGYVGAKRDLSGRGFLGFRQTIATDPQTGLVQTTNYLQGFPYIGRVLSKARTVGAGASAPVLSQTTNSYQFSNATGAASVSVPSVTSAPYAVSLSGTTATGADLDGSALPTVTTSYQYDAYGNATQITSSTPDGASKVTTNSYSNDTTSWFIGRLTGASVTSTVP
jgi:hypothetical protein